MAPCDIYSKQKTNQCTEGNVRVGHTCLEGKRITVVIATAEDASFYWQNDRLGYFWTHPHTLSSCKPACVLKTKRPNYARDCRNSDAAKVRPLCQHLKFNASSNWYHTELQPWATIVLRHISKLYMTGREQDNCTNMCHAAMETGQMNSSQKDLKNIQVMQEKDCSLKCNSHVLPILRGVDVTDGQVKLALADHRCETSRWVSLWLRLTSTFSMSSFLASFTPNTITFTPINLL